MRALGKLRQYISQNPAINVYKALLLPHFDYADVIYDVMSHQNVAQIQGLQNRCLRICLKREPRSNTKDLHNDANICTLASRRKQHCCNLVHKGLEQTSSPGVNSMFSTIGSNRDRVMRASENQMLDVPICKLVKSQNNFRIRGAMYYNQLPQSTKGSSSHKAFKANVKKHDFE